MKKILTNYALRVSLYAILLTGFSSCEKENAEPDITPVIEYPAVASGRVNILGDSAYVFERAQKYTVAAIISGGASVRVVCKPGNEKGMGGAGFWPLENNGWIFNNYPGDSTTLKLEGPDWKQAEIPFWINGPQDSAVINFLIFENGSDTVTRMVTVKG